MFKFSFQESDENSESYQNKQNWRKSQEISFSENVYVFIKDSVTMENVMSLTLPNTTLRYLTQDGVLHLLNKYQNNEESLVIKAEQYHSDLLPAVYEGGLKIWECTYDILNFMDKNSLKLENQLCLDLGCGSGLVGVYCLLKGAKNTFQDYNSEVIRYLTIPNVILNRGSSQNCTFYCGDWKSFNDLLSNSIEEQNKFDFIFTSETIYNIDNYLKLHNVLKDLLKKTGTVFLAAKSYYFGVGGGIALFKKFLDDNNIFKYETCWENNEGLKRTILKINFI